MIQDGQSVAHGAVAGFGQQGESVLVGFDFFPRRQGRAAGHDLLEPHGAKTEMLAAGADGLRNILRLRRGQHEDDVAGRLLQRFQQGVEGGIGDLVRFVEDVDLEAVPRRAIAGGLAKFADLVDAAVGGGVDFDYIDGISGADFGAGLANAARFRHGLVGRSAVERHGQDARDGGLADAAVAAEDVAVGGTSLLDGVLQGAGNVFLSDDLGELLRTVFARQNLIAHGREDLIIRDARGGAGRRGNLVPRSGASGIIGQFTCAMRHKPLANEFTPRDRLFAAGLPAAQGGSPCNSNSVPELWRSSDCGLRWPHRFRRRVGCLARHGKEADRENSQIVLNLGGVSYIDSGGLGTLVALYTTAHNAGGSIKLANLTQRVGDLLQVTKLLTVFEVYDSEEKAIQSFRKGRRRLVSMWAGCLARAESALP